MSRCTSSSLNSKKLLFPISLKGDLSTSASCAMKQLSSRTRRCADLGQGHTFRCEPAVFPAGAAQWRNAIGPYCGSARLQRGRLNGSLSRFLRDRGRPSRPMVIHRTALRHGFGSRTSLSRISRSAISRAYRSVRTWLHIMRDVAGGSG